MAEIAEVFYRPLGRVVVKFGKLDDALAMAIFTFMNEEPVSNPQPGITALSGPTSQEKFRFVISSMPTADRAETLRCLAEHSFPNDKAEITNLIKRVKKAIELRNEFIHHNWHDRGHIGSSHNGKPRSTKRTAEEVDAFADQLVGLTDEVTFLHFRLLGLDDSTPKKA